MRMSNLNSDVTFDVNLNIDGHFEKDLTVTFNRDSYNRIIGLGGEAELRRRIKLIVLSELDIDIDYERKT